MKKDYYKGLLLINETFIIDHSIFEEWISFFRNSYVRFLKESPYVRDVVLSKVQGGYNPDGENYALQFKINEKDFPEFKNNEKFKEIRKIINEKFKNQYASFETILEVEME
jgi:hypothetical protein